MRKMKFLWKKRENEFSKEFYPKKERRIYQYLCGYRILFWQLKEDDEYSCAVTPQIRQTGNRLSGNAGTAYASLLA